MYSSNWGAASFGALTRMRILVIATIAALLLMFTIAAVPALADEGAGVSEDSAAETGEAAVPDPEGSDGESGEPAGIGEPDVTDGTPAEEVSEPEAPANTGNPEPTVDDAVNAGEDVTTENTDTEPDGSNEATGESEPETENLTIESDEEIADMSVFAVGDRPLGAVQDMPYCTANSLPRNDDGSSPAVTLPFTLNFFGQEHDTLYVNNNGNVTFDSPMSTYTPFNLTGNTGTAMIAPYFADIDTGNLGSLQTTYGSQGDSFCVNWVDVGYYDERADKLISAQLIIKDLSDQAPGAFRMTFNYGPMEWETGEASDGVDGLGGDSVAVGYTSGTGTAGEFIQLAGSLVNGALIDGGSNALSAGSRNSNTPGRYIFDVGLSDVIQQGNLDGTVKDADGVPVDDAEISVCDSANVCITATTSAAGAYSVAGLTVGDYTVTAAAPADSGLLNASAPGTVNAGETTTVDLVLNKVPDNPLTGIVFDEDGDPFSGATVTLEKLLNDTYVVVPSGWEGLHTNTSANPVDSAADGTFNWTVADGTYRVVAKAENCEAVTSEPVTRPIEGEEVVDPAVNDFEVTLVCVDPPVVEPPVVEPPVVTPPVTAPVVPPATVPPASGLADTGTEVTAPVAVALLLVGLGAAGIMTRRRMQV